MASFQAVFVGECMVELVRDQGRWRNKIGGDTINTAIYAARLIHGLEKPWKITYITNLGQDAQSTQLINEIEAEGIQTNHIGRQAQGRPSIYVITTSPTGDRSFRYIGRNACPARNLLRSSTDSTQNTISAIESADLLYFTGITLAILNAEARTVLLESASRVRARGGTVVFDSNLRLALWPSLSDAIEVNKQAIKVATIALPSFEDEQAMYQDKDPADTVARLFKSGVQQVVVKQGDKGCVVAHHAAPIQLSSILSLPVKAIDTTAAGDSFNASFLTQLLGQHTDLITSATKASEVASHVIQHRGAIMDLDAWISLFSSGPTPPLQVASVPAKTAELLCAHMIGFMRVSAVLPVMVCESVEEAVNSARALVQGGLRVLEITLRTPAALDCIQAIHEQVPKAIVGAGTVINAEQFAQVKAAGAAFVVSPGCTPELVAAAVKHEMPFLPGACTPSEVMTLLQSGISCCKFFPAEAGGGVEYLKSLSGPLPRVVFCPTGGVGPNNVAAYLSLEAVLCVGGSWVVPKKLVYEKNWAAIEQLAFEASKLKK
eukprot:c6509_g1_i1.p1 GENE.c6509_g1_i1~~c6509_g1_i1.p1  ORF type:complete len:559 (+),score=150.08 c6509_g1_i1:38-1678(+)